MKNRHGYDVEVAPIEKVEHYDNGGCAISRGEPGWGTFGLGVDELNGFVPQVGDVVIVYTQGFSSVRGVIIDGHVLRYHTPAQAAAEHEQWKKNWRLEKLERYVEHGDALKERVKKLHPVLQARMARFAAEGGVGFWIDDAPYEMACLEGTQALLNKIESLDLTDDEGLKWIEEWMSLPYAEQMKKVPDFGEGHSGNTADAAIGMARIILRGEGDKL